jgi:hypothetical protein
MEWICDNGRELNPTGIEGFAGVHSFPAGIKAPFSCADKPAEKHC